ncbi:MAG TPA: ATP-binding protein [Gemmatimonadaceae bacterium]|nr:ATP-binding protein [Gemmatimonadaceae bacterium]
MSGELQAVNVREAVNEVLLMLERQLAAKGLDSVADISPDVRFLADPIRLRGILLTLISNAIRFTESGGHVMVDVGYPEGMPEDVVMLRVGDSGCGISLERQEEIFEPSVPSRHPAESDAGGTGPGLVTSRAWARVMGGDLRVRSDVDHGSVFTLKLPRA